MADNGFWKGATFGLITGAVLTRLLATKPAARMPLGGTAPAAQWTGMGRAQERGGLRLRRDEGAGDPAGLTAARTGANASFERRGGAPGGVQKPESSEVPGRPGQAIDYTDPSAPVRLSSRTLTLRRDEPWGDESSPD